MKRNWMIARWLKRLFCSAKPVAKKRRRTVRLGLERLEERWLPSTGQTFIVNDAGNPTPITGTLTLAQAISDVNADTNVGAVDTIRFNIPGSPNQVQTINIANTNPLPAVTQPVLIDGWSEGNFENSASGYKGPPLVVLHGDLAGSGINGLQLSGSSAGSTVRGLVINNFTGDGIVINSTSGNLIVGNYIGTDVNGTAALGNFAGVAIESGSTANTIGGTASGAANVISGNFNNGMFYQVGVLLSGTSGNVVLGNLIGADVHGTAALGNVTGVLIGKGSTANTIGGTASGAANVISGNVDLGVYLGDSGTSGNVVLGNLIGTDVNGAAKLGNGDGVEIELSATANTIGGTASGAANVISGNNESGVYLVGGGTSGNVVLGNLIGTDINGAAKLGNGYGVQIWNHATANTIGGTASGAANVISGNNTVGVYIGFTGTSGNVVLGNLIGTDKNGTANLGNSRVGVEIGDAATANTIGGTASGDANVISGNGGDGVLLALETGNVVLGNLIGTVVNGTANLGNGLDGVLVETGAYDNTIGGGNVISTNGASGVNLFLGSGNLVQGNLIGTDIHGTAALGYGLDGVIISNGASANTVGGTAAGSRNVISGNEYGVAIGGTGVSGNVVLGNFIGTDVNGTAALGNTRDGVVIIAGATANTIGGTVSGSANVISGNLGAGVHLLNYMTYITSGNVVLGNLIGTDAHGTAGWPMPATASPSTPGLRRTPSAAAPPARPTSSPLTL